MEVTDITLPWPQWGIVEKLGSGGFGMVSKIQRTRSGGEVEYAAVKCIRIPGSEEETQSLLSQGFSRESIRQKYQRDAADLIKEYEFMNDLKDSPNVVHCDAVAVVPLNKDALGCCLLIKMELLTPLGKVLDQSYNEGQVIALGMDICRALAACRKHNIIHRDIKPANILVSDDRKSYKLGDFGVSKTQDHTASGTKTGTWAFMAPEIYNSQKYNASVDIYSLGMVLYWMMNRRCEPFLPLPPTIPTAKQMESARERRFNGELLPMPVNGSIALKKAVLRACDPNPQNRFGSPEEMYSTLAAIPAAPNGTVDGAYHYSYVSRKQGSTQDGAMDGGKTYGNDWGSESDESVGAKQDAGPQPGGTLGSEKQQGKKQNVYTSLDVRITLKLSKEEAANGCQKTVTIPGGKKVTVNVPKQSSKQAAQLQLPGLGKEDPATGAKGTLYVKLVVDGDFWEGDKEIPVSDEPFYLSPKDNNHTTVTFRMYEPACRPIKVVIPSQTAKKKNPVDATGYIVNVQKNLVDTSAADSLSRIAHSEDPIPLKINTVLVEDPTDIQKTPDSLLKKRMDLAMQAKGCMFYVYLLLMVCCIGSAIGSLSIGQISAALFSAFLAFLFFAGIAPPNELTKREADEAKAELERRYGLWIR